MPQSLSLHVTVFLTLPGQALCGDPSSQPLLDLFMSTNNPEIKQELQPIYITQCGHHNVYVLPGFVLHIQI